MDNDEAEIKRQSDEYLRIHTTETPLERKVRLAKIMAETPAEQPKPEPVTSSLLKVALLVGFLGR